MKALAISLALVLALVTPSLAKVKVAPKPPTTSIKSGSVNPIVISRDRALNG